MMAATKNSKSPERPHSRDQGSDRVNSLVATYKTPFSPFQKSVNRRLRGAGGTVQGSLLGGSSIVLAIRSSSIRRFRNLAGIEELRHSEANRALGDP